MSATRVRERDDVRLHRLFNALADHVETIPDDEILADAQADGRDVERDAEIQRERLLTFTNEARR